MPTFTYVSEYGLDREAVFALHKNPDMFSLLTPPGMGEVTIPHSDGINVGSEVAIRVSHPLLSKYLPELTIPGFGKGPVGLPWRVRHVVLEEPTRFEDVQVAGPFKAWHHYHLFSETPDSRTVITDIIEWELPWYLKPATPLVAHELRKMFEYREKSLAKHIRDTAHR